MTRNTMHTGMKLTCVIPWHVGARTRAFAASLWVLVALGYLPERSMRRMACDYAAELMTRHMRFE